MTHDTHTQSRAPQSSPDATLVLAGVHLRSRLAAKRLAKLGRVRQHTLQPKLPRTVGIVEVSLGRRLRVRLAPYIAVRDEKQLLVRVVLEPGQQRILATVLHVQLVRPERLPDAPIVGNVFAERQQPVDLQMIAAITVTRQLTNRLIKNG